jgi:hypothetical protein
VLIILAIIKKKSNQNNRRSRNRRAQVKFPNKKLTKKQKAKRELYLDKRDYSPSLSIKTRIDEMNGPLH